MSRAPHKEHDDDAVAAYMRAVSQVTGVRPRFQIERVQGETFLVLSVPVGDRYADMGWRSRADDEITAIILRDAPDHLGAIIVDYQPN